MTTSPSTTISETKSHPNEPSSSWIAASLTAATVATALVVPGALYLRRKRNLKFSTGSAPPRRRTGNTTVASLPYVQAATSTSKSTSTAASTSRSIKARPTTPTSQPRIESHKAASVEASDAFSPALYAMRALGIATILVSIGAIGGVWVVKTALDVRDTEEFAQKMRRNVVTRMPILSSRIHRPLEDEDDNGDEPPAPVDRSWNWHDAEQRLKETLDKDGVMAWAEVAVKELVAEERLERAKRKELQDNARRQS